MRNFLDFIHFPWLPLIIWLALTSLIGVILTIVDKRHSAKQGKTRVPERKLFLFGALGGAFAMLVTMKKIRHKTQHRSFMWGFPAMIFVHLVLLGWVVYAMVR